MRPPKLARCPRARKPRFPPRQNPHAHPGNDFLQCAARRGRHSANARRRRADSDEFKIKRQEVFEFTRRPAVTQQGDQVTIAFTSKAFCDATVAIEDQSGKIVRHLVCGVLGPNAPAPFQKDSLNQTIVWDGKDEQGVYIDNKDAISVRVSLGLKPVFERTLFWSPHRRVGMPSNVPATPPALIAARRRGSTSTTPNRSTICASSITMAITCAIYPFPADKLKGGRRPALAEGAADRRRDAGDAELSAWDAVERFVLKSFRHGTGFDCQSMAVQGKRIALACEKLNRLASDGSSGGVPLEGPTVGFPPNTGGIDARDEIIAREA